MRSWAWWCAVLFVLAALLAPWLASEPGRVDLGLLPLVPFGPDTLDLEAIRRPPSARHWLGTDDVGRDVLARLLHGTRPALLVGGIVVALQLLVGILLGALGAFGGRTADYLVRRLIDSFLSMPPLLVALLLAAWFGPGLWTVVLSLSAIGWTTPARLLRARLLELRSADFVLAARALGVGRLRLFWRHTLPHALGPLRTFAVLGVANAVLLESALSFLGLGVEPSVPTWGSLAAQGRSYALEGAWHLGLFPGLVVVLLVATLQRLGRDGEQRVAG